MPSPRVLSFGAAARRDGAERRAPALRTSRRARSSVSVGTTAIALEGRRDHRSIRSASASARVAAPRSCVRAEHRRSLARRPGAATGELVLRDQVALRRCTCPGPSRCPPMSTSYRGWRSRRPEPVSRTRPPLRSRSSPASVTATPDPQVRAVELLEVELWRAERESGGSSLPPRALLPGQVHVQASRERASTGARLPRGHVCDPLLVAFPGDGTRRQADTIDYRVRWSGSYTRPRRSSQEATLDVNRCGGIPSPRGPVRAGEARSSAVSARSSRSIRT